MSQMVRKFVFFTPVDWQRFTAFCKANIKPMAEQERYLQAVVSEYKKSRSAESNSFMWVGLLDPMSEQAWQAGRRLSPEGWNLVMKILHLPDTCAKGVDKWLYTADGDRTLMMSTTDLNTAEMGLYLTKCSAYAASDLGVHLPVNPRDL